MQRDKTLPMKDLSGSAERLLGRTPDDPELQTFLKTLGRWPLPPFGPEELTIYWDKALGFCLVFDDSSTVKHSIAAGNQAGTPIFVGTFFYAEGVDGYHAYAGPLPYGITWSDTANSLV